MKRGEIWTVAGGGHTGKPRPAIIVQNDRFAATDSITVCPVTSIDVDIPLFRVSVEPTSENGLRAPSRIMADKITTVQRARVGRRIGVLNDEKLVQLNRAIALFLSLGSPPRPVRRTSGATR